MNEVEVRHIKQGELYFGRGSGVLKTLLGSCVAVILWQAEKRLGGMCHIVLPDSNEAREVCSNRFADCAIKTFVTEIMAAGTQPADYWVGVYGGGNMFPTMNFDHARPIGEKNLISVCNCLKEYGFHVRHKDVGRAVYRMLTLNLGSGEVTLKNTDVPVTQSILE